jgi:hypothetical protein
MILKSRKPQWHKQFGQAASTRCAQRFKSIVASIVGLLLQPVNPRQLLGVTAQRAVLLANSGIHRADPLTQFRLNRSVAIRRPAGESNVPVANAESISPEQEHEQSIR